MSLRSIAHALFRHRRLMLVVVLTALTLGGFVAMLHQPAWRAEATLLAESRRPDAARALAALFESRDLHDSVLTRMGEALYPGLPPADRAAAFARGLTVEPAAEAPLVRVAFDGPDPALAARSLAALMDGVRARNATVFSVASGDDAIREAKAAREDLVAFRKRNNLFDPVGERDGLLRRRAELEGHAVAAESEAAALTDKLALLKSRLQSTPATIALQTESERTRVVDEARAKLFELQTKEQELLGKYHEGSVFVQRVQGERRKVQTLLDQMMTTADTRVTQGTNLVHQEIEKELFRTEAALTSAKARAKTVARQLADIDRRLDVLGGAEGRLKELEANAMAADSALGGYKGNAIDAIGVVQAAAAGSRPIGPGRLGIVAIAAAAGLLLAMVLAALAQRLSTRFSTPADVERRLGLPVLTTIPRES